jgi:hypothetical protein
MKTTNFILKIVALFTLLLVQRWLFPEETSKNLNAQSTNEINKLADQPSSDSSAVSL